MECPTYTPLIVETKTTEHKILAEDGTVLITLTAEHPQLHGETRGAACRRINRYYTHTCEKLVRYCETKLRRQAEEEYAYCEENGFPFRQFDVSSAFFVTYNDGCWLSFYTDVYEYTGGAHGGTIRFGDIWQCRFGSPAPASVFFPSNVNYRKLLIASATETAAQQLAEGSAVYFDNYPELIRKNFSCGNVYLTETGMALFYQQYDIAPYVEGIPVFITPYSETGPLIPCCTD